MYVCKGGKADHHDIASDNPSAHDSIGRESLRDTSNQQLTICFFKKHSTNLKLE